MQLFINSFEDPGGPVVPVPPALSPHLIPAATTVFREQAFGWTLIQEIDFPQGKLVSWRIRVREPVTLYPTNRYAFLAWHGLTKGSVTGELQGHGLLTLREGESRLFYLPAGIHQAHFAPGEYESILIALPLADMREAAKLHEPVRSLLNALRAASREGRPLDPVPMDYIVYRVLDELRSFPGPAEKYGLRFRKLSLELLIAYLAKVQEYSLVALAPIHPYEEVMFAIRAHVEAAPNVQEHTIAKTARRFLVSETILKRSFRAVFGQSFAQFVRSQALEKAHYLIRTSSLSLADIAESVGYRSLKILTVPFSRRFGYAPDWLRKEPKKPESSH